MTVNAASGARLFIGTTGIPLVPKPYNPLTDAAALLADFQADSYIEVGEVEDGGEFGDQSETINFTSLSDGRVRKFKGPRDAGTMNIVVGDDPTDVGQDALVAAEAQIQDYNFKIVLNDAASLGGSGSEHYFYAKVMSKRQNLGQANNIVRRTFALGINSPIVEVDPT